MYHVQDAVLLLLASVHRALLLNFPDFVGGVVGGGFAFMISIHPPIFLPLPAREAAQTCSLFPCAVASDMSCSLPMC